MAEENKTEGFEQLAKLWQQSQDAFVKAQEDISEQFQKSLNEMAGTIKQEAKDPLAAWQEMMKAWVPNWDDNKFDVSSFPAGLDFKKGQQAFYELLEPQKWTQYMPEQLRIMLERIAHGPQFADLAIPQQKMAEVWREGADFQKAAADMSQVMQGAWTKAYEGWSKTHSVDELREGKMNDAMQDWLKSANEALLEAQGSSAFLDAQKRMIRSSTEIRARQKDMAEEWSEAWQMPTRSEIDDLSRMVYQLRRELRETKRELDALKGKLK